MSSTPFADTNQFVITGKVCQKPVLGETKNGKPKSEFSVASRTGSLDKLGRQMSQFYRIICFGSLCDLTIDKLDKGMRVVVSGRINDLKWQQNGTWREKCEFVAKHVGLLLEKNNTIPEGIAEGSASDEEAALGEGVVDTAGAPAAATETEEIDLSDEPF